MSPKPAISRTSATNLPPPSLRRRLGSAYLSPSPDPTRTWRGLNESRKGSIAIGATSGRDSDAISRRLSLGGVAPLENPPGTQNYVEPGYAILNPAYEQPANVRPVWSLAKPLPHVLGPAILPSKNELRRELLRHRDEDDEFDQFEDPELGGRHPTLRSDNISNDLDNIRRDRERRLLDSYLQNREASPAFSPFSGTRKGSVAEPEAPSGHRRVEETIIEEEEEQSQHGRKSLQHSELDFPHLSQAIANVNRAKEEETLDTLLQDVVPLTAHRPQDVKVHNIHNLWGYWRKKFCLFLAELLGVRSMNNGASLLENMLTSCVSVR